ncbi:MAG: 50S ribosomal protein L24 [Methanosphaera sp. rholeuAM74]|nr:MAG: 50S ribosomal protein L24 [Methanosphaera sp. rholeuAM74]
MSKQPRKQRKALYTAPLHKRHNKMSVHLSDALRQEFNRRAFPVRKGDEVLIVRGDFKGTTGKVEGVDLKHYRVMVDGASSNKQDGTKLYQPIHPSNLEIIDLYLDDERRNNALNRKV